MNMMDSEGKPISIEVVDKKYADKENKYLYSEITNVIKKNLIEIAAPIVKSNYFYIPKGAALKIYCEQNQENSKEFLLYSAKIEEIKKDRNIPSFLIKIKGKGKKTQRRSFFRLNNDAGIVDDIIINDNKDDVRYSICDISASGARLTSNKELQKGQIIKLTIFTEKGENLVVKGKVLRTQKSEEKYKSQKYESGIDFFDILPYKEDLIVKYILAKQRNLLYSKNR